MMHPRPFGTKFPLFLTMAVFSSVVVLSTGSASAQLVIRVPVDQPTIQSAIDAAVATGRPMVFYCQSSQCWMSSSSSTLAQW